MKVFRFLAFVNQSDWQAAKLIDLIDKLQDDNQIKAVIAIAENDFKFKNENYAKRDKPLIPHEDLQSLKDILKITPLQLGVIDAADNWVIETQKELGRLPNTNEWSRFLVSPLDGKIGMSFALQWRYNFGRLFKVP